ncbi:NAD(P)/FAD-dependent oxidoreductase [Chitinophagaceae bacterium MMS25-I14]
MAYKIAIIGGGAAGCFAAANIAADEGSSVHVFEKTGKVLQKVKASGGGRCNVTHACFDVPELLTRYPRGKQLLRKTLYPFSPEQTIAWFKERGVLLKKEEDGRMFPITDESQTIIDCIWQEMMRRKVTVQYHKAVESIEPLMPGFRLHFTDKTTFEADKVLVATGGFPKPEQYKWLEALGHSIESPVPSLFTFNMPGNPVTELMGVSVPDASVKIAGTKIQERGPLLITHWGMSGPAILRTSAYAARELHGRGYEFQALINWLGDATDADIKEIIAEQRKEQGKQFVFHKNPFGLPRRLWEYQLQQCGVTENTRWGELPAAAQNKLVEKLVRDTYAVKGKTTFKEEFVTCGGIRLAEIDPLTMESRKVQGLYFAGEILDADGITGGYNFQHAWSSAWAASRAIIQQESR